jgi:hypothetical protein
MKTLSFRFCGSVATAALCASVAACGGSTFTDLDGDAAAKGGGGSGSSSGGATSSGSSSGTTAGSSSGSSSGTTSGSSSGTTSGSSSGTSSGSSSGTTSGSSGSSSGTTSGSSSGASSSSSGGGASDGGAGDAGASDAGPGVFACGPTVSCDGRTQYCEIRIGGVVLADGGGNKTYVCTAFPLKCAGDHSCACIATSPAQQCTESDGDVTLTTDTP